MRTALLASCALLALTADAFGGGGTAGVGSSRPATAATAAGPGGEPAAGPLATKDLVKRVSRSIWGVVPDAPR